MLTDIIEAAPFIDVVLDEEPQSPQLPLLNPGFNRDHASSQLFPNILKARIALATQKEAYRNLPDDSSVLTHQSLLEAVFSCRLDGQVSSVSNPLRKPEEVNAAVSQRALPQLLSLPIQGVDLQLLETLSRRLGSDHFRDDALDSSEIFSSRINPPANRSEVDRFLGNWIEYVELAGRQTEPLVVVAVAYYQLLAISPRVKGNPAFARTVLQLLLVDMGLIDKPVLGLSREILLNETEHRLLFEDVALSGNWHKWLVFCIDLIYRSAERSTQLLHRYQDIETDTRHRITTVLPKLDHEELTALLFQRPVCRIRDLVERSIAKRQTASVYLKTLAVEGVVAEEQRGKEKWFFNNRYLALFD